MCVRRRLRRAFAEELEHARNVVSVVGADVSVPLVGVQVIIAIRKREPTLANTSDDLGAVLGILLGAEAEERWYAFRVKPRNFCLELRTIPNGSDPRQFGRDRLGARPLSARGIHARRVVNGQLAKIRTSLRVPARGRIAQDGQEVALIVLGQLREAAPYRIRWWYRM